MRESKSDETVREIMAAVQAVKGKGMNKNKHMTEARDKQEVMCRTYETEVELDKEEERKSDFP